MHFIPAARLLSTAVLLIASAHGAPQVTTGHSPADAGFKLGKVPPPAVNDAAAKATFTLADGRKDGPSAELSVLTDGKVPGGDDEPRSNFFFAQGTNGGRIVADLGEITPVKSVATYSWHRGGRGPQVYQLYAATGKEAKFDPAPKRPLDPKDAGWTAITGDLLAVSASPRSIIWLRSLTC